MALPVDVALPLAIVCALAVEITGAWLLFWFLRIVRFCGFYLSRSDQYGLDHPSFFEQMREQERFFEDFDASIAFDPVMVELQWAEA